MNRAVFILGLVLFAQSCSDNAIEVREVKWDCEKEECEVTFQLINTGPIETNVQFTIRAHKRYTQGQGAVRNEVIGESKGNLLMPPGKTVNVQETFRTSGKPYQIVVSAWKS